MFVQNNQVAYSYSVRLTYEGIHAIIFAVNKV